MVNSDWVKYKIEVRERLKVFSLDVLKLIDMLISANICTNDFIKKIYKESLELVKILATMRREVS